MAALRSQAESKLVERKEDMSSPACFAARDSASFWAWKKQKCGWPERRGVRHWRPSAKVKEHKPERSLERLVDMEVSRKEGFEFLEGLAEGEADF